MSNNLDKSLDEIIGKKPIRATRDNKRGPKKASKQVGKRRNVANSGRNNRPARIPVGAVSRIVGHQLVKVNVEGLPRDIKQSAVREFFAGQVGGVHGVLLSYNERGQSTGMANITFKSAEYANKAVSRFNGAPIDNGKTRLKLNLIVDPTLTNQNLAQRLTGLQGRVGKPNGVIAGRPNARNVGRNGRPMVSRQQQVRGPQRNGPQRNGPQRNAPVAQKKRQPKREKPAKKSLEDLDKEMADYFDDGK
ncbi:similar to Saccharomyces cerevisiae YDR381W YRA1 RNA binding protein required for export of poly(A)+ mRNA from the nucleus [Maudiozyma saulgeensis]|uniref:Similar to Saccharomyces cerevisiae YDR381W YRA1 RNA binding protein required for export of poly(A)+ mRNA from the nucleus n=1 Tax=Maudiozyma saulgeensis TaxID=1789683 RepID=A0A1X7R2E6_9SACH|nr:similar to Saccharomyces cerevisiae YDR381W YRA1 RNA binding protein required for export of poly(A)+ mRNA from the nucleus [Kazachstania saulgeensis]